MRHAVLSLGSNMGDSREILSAALRAIGRLPFTKVTKCSRFYRTAPWGGVAQEDFLNLAAEVETGLSPKELLTHLQQLELDAGRVRDVRWGPRTLDIDIILYEGVIRDDPLLTLPHPRYTERAFVLRPMLDLYPDGVALGVDFSRHLPAVADQELTPCPDINDHKEFV